MEACSRSTSGRRCERAPPKPLPPGVCGPFESSPGLPQAVKHGEFGAGVSNSGFGSCGPRGAELTRLQVEDAETSALVASTLCFGSLDVSAAAGVSTCTSGSPAGTSTLRRELCAERDGGAAAAEAFCDGAVASEGSVLTASPP